MVLQRLDQPWTPAAHHCLYHAPLRQKLREAMLLGYHLAMRPPFASRSHELIDCWVGVVLPALAAAEDATDAKRCVLAERRRLSERAARHGLVYTSF